MELLRRTLGKIIPLALERVDMQQHGLIIFLRHLKGFAELLNVVAVNGTYIMKPEILEPGVGIYNALEGALYIKRCIGKRIANQRNML